VLTGLSRLTVRVARLLAERGGTLTVLASSADDELMSAMPEGAQVVIGDGDYEDRLRRVDLAGAACLLTLGEDDLENLRIVAAANEVAPNVPVVLRAFDAMLAEQLETGHNVRRCFSSSALAAPAFVAAVFSEEVRETLRVGDAEVPMCVLTVSPDSPLVGKSFGEMKREWGCAAVARRRPGGAWEHARGDTEVIGAGDELVVGGLLLDVLRLALQDNPALADPPRRPRQRLEAWRARARRTPTMVTAAAIALIVLLALTIGVFAYALDVGPADAVYRALTNAFGDVGLSKESEWLKIFGVAVMVAGALLIGIVFTHLTAMFTADRIEERSGRRAQRMRNHVIVAGLGTVGFRVARLLDDLEVPTVVIERAADNRFREAVASRVPVLSGDVRLAENLERASIAEARCLVACTDDELTNVAVCAQARRMNPGIRTVARCFDDTLSQRLGGFGIDDVVSMSRAAAGAFAGAAIDERAARYLKLGDLELVAFRHEVERDLTADEVAAWRGEGARVLAVQPPGGRVFPPVAALDGLAAGSLVILAGPEPILQRFLDAR